MLFQTHEYYLNRLHVLELSEELPGDEKWYLIIGNRE